jgi:CRP/FNR family transcriptional regulator, cyclic AMP receptor protein
VNSLESFLSEVPVFQKVDQNTLTEIANRSSEKSFQAQEIICYQGDNWPFLFLVKSGHINAIKESPEGRSFITTSLYNGDIFWGLSFFIQDNIMPVMLRAYKDSTIYLWSREKLVPILRSNGELAWKLSQTMIARMQLAGDIVDELAFLPVTGRLSALLLETFEDSEDEFVARELTLDDMASHIGTTREVVCRHLHRFAEKGVIEITRTKIRIKNRDQLKTQSSL